MFNSNIRIGKLYYFKRLDFFLKKGVMGVGLDFFFEKK